MSPLRHTTAAIGLLALAVGLSSAPARGDDVLLHNGNSFEGVIVVSESADQVKIRLAYGEMSLPRSWISRIDRTDSALADYIERRQILRGRSDVDVAEWLSLARWARSRDLRHGFKEAVLEASRIDPRHPEHIGFKGSEGRPDR